METKIRTLDKIFIFFYSVINKKGKEPEYNVGIMVGFIAMHTYVSIWGILSGLLKIKLEKTIINYLIPVVILVLVTVLFNMTMQKNDRHVYLKTVYEGKSKQYKNRCKFWAIALFAFSIVFGFLIAPLIGYNLEHR